MSSTQCETVIRPARTFPGYYVAPGGDVFRKLRPGKQGVFLYRGGVKVKRRPGGLAREAFGR